MTRRKTHTTTTTTNSAASRPDDSLLAYSSDESGCHTDAYFLQVAGDPHYHHTSLTYSPTSSPDPNESFFDGSRTTANKNTNTKKKVSNDNNTYGSFEPSCFSGNCGSFLFNSTKENPNFRVPIIPSNSISNENNTLFQIGQFSQTPQDAWISSYYHNYQLYDNNYYQNNHGANTERNNNITASSTRILQHHYKASTDFFAQRRILRHKHKEQEAREKLVQQVRGTNQPEEEWKDVGWLILFLFHILVVIFCAIRYGSNSIFTHKPIEIFPVEADDNPLRNIQNIGLDKSSSLTEVATDIASQLFHIDYQTVLEVVIITGFYACVLSALTIGFMLMLSRSLLQTALIFTLFSALGWGLIGLAVKPFYMISTMGFCALGITLAYTLWVWERIPFAGINLHTALCGMRSSLLILLMGIAMSLLAFGWFIVWSIAFIGIVDYQCNNQDCYNILVYTLLIISLCWTQLVIKVIGRRKHERK
mmetsp:Transcript_23801/g.27091  ORF Transcript_23801/g.27091 Transcript_23801/m.27091 type:complete len:477 (-) Transcript_23801:11-1441(-)